MFRGREILSYLFLLLVVNFVNPYGYGNDFSFPEEDTSGRFSEIFRWKQFEFENLPPEYMNLRFGPDNWPYFDQYANVPTGVTHHNGRVFISIPRRGGGIPSTLNYIDVDNGGDMSPKLKPYPDYARNLLQTDFSKSMNFVSVYRTRVDKCNRLWFIDTGSFDFPTSSRQVQQPALYAIDLNLDTVVVRYEIPENLTRMGIGLVALTVDVVSDCTDTFVYITDFRGYVVFVYDVKGNRMWRFQHNSFYPDQLGGNFNIGGFQFMWNNGVFTMALGPPQPPCNYRNAYYHSMSGTKEFFVNTEVLRNETASTRRWHGNDFRYLGDHGPMQETTITATDATNTIMFYANVHRNGISCWNLRKPFNSRNIVPLDSNPNWIYPVDLTIDDKDNIFFLTNSFPIQIFGRLNTDTFNFRIMRQTVKNVAYKC